MGAGRREALVKTMLNIGMCLCISPPLLLDHIGCRNLCRLLNWSCQTERMVPQKLDFVCVCVCERGGGKEGGRGRVERRERGEMERWEEWGRREKRSWGREANEFYLHYRYNSILSTSINLTFTSSRWHLILKNSYRSILSYFQKLSSLLSLPTRMTR